jgi:hypothetical protein
LEPVRQYAEARLRASEAATNELGEEYPNSRYALRWTVQTQQPLLGLRLARTVQFFWAVRGPYSEGAAWLEQLLQLPSADECRAAFAVALLTAGRLSSMNGRFDAADAHYERGLPLARRSDNPWIRWLGPQNVGVNMAVRWNLVRAQELFREARDVARAANDVVDEGITLTVMAHAALVCRRV